MQVSMMISHDTGTMLKSRTFAFLSAGDGTYKVQIEDSEFTEDGYRVKLIGSDEIIDMITQGEEVWIGASVTGQKVRLEEI